jgi:two-component system, response regulator YesN
MILKNHTNLFRRYLASYMLVMVVSLLIASIVHIASLKTIESGVIENRLILLEHNTSVIDEYLSRLQEITEQIRFNTRLMSYLYKERLQAGSNEVFDLITTHKNLASYTVASPFSESFFIYYQRSELVLSRPSVHYGFSHHYNNVLSLPDMDEQTWYSYLFDRYHQGSFLSARQVTINANDPSYMIPYMETVPSPEQGSSAVIVILIEDAEIQHFLREILGDTPGMAAIVDRLGRPITTVGQGDFPVAAEEVMSVGNAGDQYAKHSVGGKDVRIAQVRSSFNDWTYVTAIPDRVLMQSAVRIRTIMVAIAVAAILVGIVLSYVLAYRNSKPLQDVLAILRGALRTDTHDAYQLLRSSVQALMESNHDLHNTVDNQKSALTSSFLNLLINGDFAGEEDIDEIISYSTFRLQGPEYVTCVLRISHTHENIDGSAIRELDLARVITEDALKSYVGDRAEWMILRPAEILVLFSSEQSGEADFRVSVDDKVSALQDVLDTHYRVRTIAGIGINVRRLIDVHRSYNTAMQALNSVTDRARRKVWFDDLRLARRVYDYPLEVETRLLGFARAGNIGEVERIVEEIRRSNEVETPHDLPALRNLIRAIIGTVYRLAEERREFGRILPDIPTSGELETGNIDDLFSLVRRLFVRICDLANAGKRSHNQILIDRILEHVDTHYLDHNLSVAHLSSMFNLSETYFSSFFKEQTGILFSAYVETKRIEHACDVLLHRDGETLDKVAQAVGYTNTRTFRRAFKKLKGVTPSQFGGA